MKPRRKKFKRAELLSPWLTIGMLAAMAWALPNRYQIDPQSNQQKQRVAAAMNTAPFFINGKWVGEDARDKIPREAQQLLRPNALLSRTYTAPGEPAMHVLVIHCGDARDMIGHYPPVCYPSSGWVAREPEGGMDLALRVLDQRFPMREYRFSRARNLAGEDVIRVFNTFVLPDGLVTPHIEAISRQSERLAVTVRGVAQVQVIMMATVPAAQAQAAAAELLNGMSELLQTLAIREGESS
jgi:hypothetical protein